MINNERLKAGIIGLGVGERHIEGYEADARCRVTTLCDLDASKLHEVGGRNPGRKLTLRPSEVLEDAEIDVVSIASYDDVHAEQVISAVEQGKHVFVEKPLCLHEEELQALAQVLAQRPEVSLSSNLILRLAPALSELRDRVSKGDLGQIYYLEGSYDYGRISKIVDGWRGHLPFYSVMIGGGIHLIDLFVWIVGEPVVEVVAYGNRIATRDTQFRHNDLVVALLKFENGAIAKVTANFGCMAPHHHEVSVYGTKATFVQGRMGAAYFHSRDPNAPIVMLNLIGRPSKGDMLPRFVSSILDGTLPHVSTREVFAAMSVALAIEQSLSTSSPQAVRYVYPSDFVDQE